MPLFDRYLIVDWSAADRPVTGSHSIWFALYDGTTQTALENISTRVEAMGRIREIIRESVNQGKRLIAGFDFAFGYPFGAAERIGGKGSWEALWASLSERIDDSPDNKSNAFEVAGRINEESFGPSAGPFWGHPFQHSGRYDGLTLKKTRRAMKDVPEFRRVERIAKGAKSVWQLAFSGAVGKQTMLGMAYLERLRRDPAIADYVAVWPFETHFVDDLKKPVVIAEIYPSLFPIEKGLHEHKDAAQVITVAERFAHLDAEGEFGAFLDAPEMIAEERAIVENEEGWIVGAGHDLAAKITPPKRTIPDRLHYVREPDAIYRQSFEMIGEVAELADVPEAVRPVATRIVHACGMPEIVASLRYSDDIADAVGNALAGGADIYCDVETLRHGVMKHLLPDGCALHCAVSAPETAEYAKREKMTRSAAQVDLWGDRLAGQIVAIGNAPTTLFRLLERIDAGAARPAAIIAFPVGFVGAAESKDELADNPRGVPFITLTGRWGGTAMAQAAVNGLAGGLAT